jgi:hypothetical protein
VGVDNPTIRVTIEINFEIKEFVLNEFLEGFYGKGINGS